MAVRRTDSQGCLQTVLDVNDVQADGDFISIGQVKIAPNQQQVAYTVGTANGKEAYDVVVQSIGGKVQAYPSQDRHATSCPSL